MPLPNIPVKYPTFQQFIESLADDKVNALQNQLNIELGVIRTDIADINVDLSDTDSLNSKVAASPSVTANTTHRNTTTGNPHQVTKAEVGLGNVPNHDFTAEVAANTAKVGITTQQVADIISNNAHRNTTTGNPHAVTKAEVGLGDVPNIDCTNASNIISGTLPLSVMPAGALERLVVVSNQAARFALTVEQIQNGDTVKQADNGIMYRVVDDTKLNANDGYVEYSAARAAAVDWGGVENKPANYTPSVHDNSAHSINYAAAAVTINPGPGLVGGGNLSSNRELALTGQALALHNVSVNGILTRTAVGEVAARSIVGANGVTVTDGNGVSGNPTVSNSDRGSSQFIFKTIANAAGTSQFAASANADAIRFEATGAASVSFDPATKKVTFTATNTDTTYSAGNGLALTGSVLSLGTPSTVSGASTNSLTAESHTHALSVTWNDVQSKPATFPPSTHGHSAADISSGTLSIARIPTGTTAETVCIGNDARLSNARTPTAHQHGGGDITTAVASAIDAINCSRQVIAGTGCTGGGVLNADRTINVTYGTTAGTACQGDDSRVVGAAPAANPTFTGSIYNNGSQRGNLSAISAAINCALSNYFTITLSSNVTFSFSNVPAGAYGCVIRVIHNGGTITWPAAVRWPGGVAPTLETGKTHLFVLTTDNSGSRWRGAALANYVN